MSWYPLPISHLASAETGIIWKQLKCSHQLLEADVNTESSSWCGASNSAWATSYPSYITTLYLWQQYIYDNNIFMTFAGHAEKLTLQVNAHMCVCLHACVYLYFCVCICLQSNKAGGHPGHVCTFSTLSPQDDTLRSNCCGQLLNTQEMMTKQARPHTEMLLTLSLLGANVEAELSSDRRTHALILSCLHLKKCICISKSGLMGRNIYFSLTFIPKLWICLIIYDFRFIKIASAFLLNKTHCSGKSQ